MDTSKQTCGSVRSVYRHRRDRQRLGRMLPRQTDNFTSYTNTLAKTLSVGERDTLITLAYQATGPLTRPFGERNRRGSMLM